MRCLTHVARLVIAGLVAASVTQPVSAQPAAEACLAAGRGLALGAGLPRAATRLKSGALTVVAMGSSSTVGLWMRDPATTYPGVMQSELTRLQPALQVSVINSGRSGDTIPGNVARFDADVIAHHPDLVVWQVGTNDFTWLESSDSLAAKIAQGVQTLRASGADVILMDQQYAPVILASRYAKMQAAIAQVARQHRVALFPRFALMRRAVEDGLPIGALVSWDGLHLSAAGYDCVGRALARAIVAEARAAK
jgi:lysophospholipase L1-like esterase